MEHSGLTPRCMAVIGEWTERYDGEPHDITATCDLRPVGSFIDATLVRRTWCDLPGHFEDVAARYPTYQAKPVLLP